MLSKYLEVNFDVLKAITNDRYANGDNRRLVNLRSIALFNNYRLTKSSGKHLVEISHAHIVSLMYKLPTSSKGSDDLSICFDRNRDRRKQELTNNKNIKGKYHLRIYLKDIFGFSVNQETGNYGLGYKLTMTRHTDNSVLNKANTINNDKVKINSLEWYVPHYNASLEEYNKLQVQIKQKTPTNLQYPERSVFMKEVNTQNFWTSELGVQKTLTFLYGFL